MSELESFLVEGVVERDPITGYCTVRTSAEDGSPLSFDPQSVLTQLDGQEIRIVVAPLATIAQIEQLVRQLDAEENGDFNHGGSGKQDC